MKTTKPSWLRLFAQFVSLVTLVAACTNGDGTVTTTEPRDGETSTTIQELGDGDGEDGAAGAVQGDSFRVGFISNITTDNWWAAQDTLSSTYNQAYLGNGKTSLFTLTNPGFVYVPGIAATDAPVAAVQEGEIWVVEQPIQEDWMWSDGTPVTANDLVFYFETVRELDLGSNHAVFFVPSVLNLSAPDDYTVRMEFSEEPGLATWQNGVGFAPFVPAHFWEPHVEQARTSAAELAASITDEEAVARLIAASLDDDDPSNDLTADAVSPEQVVVWRAEAAANEGRSVLYEVESPMEPSVGSQIFDRWEPGQGAVTVSNPNYPHRGERLTLYSDGSVEIISEGEEAKIYGGRGSGDIKTQYVEGPYVGEILWVEHGTKEAAYESLLAGEIDFVYDPTSITSGLRDQLAADSEIEFSVNQMEGFRYLAFNMRKAPMSDRAFRQAVATVIDKELVADTILAGAVFPAYTIVHPDLTTFYNPDVERPGWRDGEPMSEAERFLEAVRILRDAGYTWESEPVIDPENDQDPVQVPGVGLTMPNGRPVPDLVLLAPGPGYDPLRATYGVWIETFIRDLGIPIVNRPSDFETIRAAVFPPQTPETAQEWDMYIQGWGRGDVSLPGTSTVAFFHSRHDTVTGGGFNTPGYKSEAFDAVADAFEAATDVETAAELTQEMDAILARDLPYVVLFRTPIIEAYRSNVRFPADNIMGGHSGFPNAWPNAVQLGD